MKYIIVTGGVMSGLGKGITAASIGRLLKNKGFRVTAIKIDPYLNCDAGTMNPFQHGEVYILKDGGEVDLDLGHYERFMNVEFEKDHNITTGKIYRAVIEKERRGEYLGSTVQIIPHITNEIKDTIRKVAEKSGAEICIVEVGGTVGDIESMPFLEAVRQMHRENPDDCIFIHVTLVPTDSMGDQKTKPSQHSVKELREVGIHPDIIVVRSKDRLNPSARDKLALFCDVPLAAVISAYDAKEIYEVPLILEEEGISDYLLDRFKLTSEVDDTRWNDMVAKMRSLDKRVRIAVVGKYTEIEDAYLSIKEALKHAGVDAGCLVDINWVEAEELETMDDLDEVFGDVGGILVPGGFGIRGSEGKIKAIEYARENRIPFLGLCFGFQLAVVEFARNVLGLEGASSAEITDTPFPVIEILPEQRDIENMGGTMRLGNSEITVLKGTRAYEIYGEEQIVERHRHRYEVNPAYITAIEDKGMIFSGKNGNRMEIVEIPSHPFFIGTQFHPEFKSKPDNPAPVFRAFVRAVRGDA